MKYFLIILGAVFFLGASLFAQSGAQAEFYGLADEILAYLQKSFPVAATAKGIHTYDNTLTDYSSGGVGDKIEQLKKFEKRLHKYQFMNLSPEVMLDWKLIKSNVDIALHDLHKMRYYQRNPYMYVSEAVNGIYYLLSIEFAPLEQRIPSLIARLKRVPTLLSQAQRNLRKPAPLHVKLAREYLAEGKIFFNAVAEDLAGQFPAEADSLKAAAQRAVSAMEEYDLFLQTITPGTEKAFALGKADFDYKLLAEHFLPFDSDSLLKIGEAMYARVDSLQKVYRADLEKRGLTGDAYFVIDCIDREDVLNYYRWETQQTFEFLKRADLMTIPEDIALCQVVETPSFLRNVISSVAYQPPGTFSPVQTGLFYVRPVPEILDSAQIAYYSGNIFRRNFRGSIVHEAWPGHHYQFVMAARLDNPIRKWQENIYYAEGWTLYCEEMMYDVGFYGDPARYLRVLNGIKFRAARIILDVKLQTGVMTPDEAAAWMSERFGDGDIEWARREINWYTLQPTVPSSYLVGKLELLKLRDEMKKREGDKFSLKSFHDKYIASGMIPPPLLWEAWGWGK